MSEIIEQGMKEAYDSIADWNDECIESNKKILTNIRAKQGKRFYKGLKKLINENIEYGMSMSKYEIVNEPIGDYEEGKYGEIHGVWVDQWSTGTEGDSYSGNISVKITDNEYLKMPYDC